MAEIYGMVAGRHHGNQERDCSRPCLFLENGRCRVKGAADCLRAAEEKPRTEWALEALVAHDAPRGAWGEWELDLLRNGASDAAVARITGRSLSGVIKRRHSLNLEPGALSFEDVIEKAREVANGR